MRNEQPAVVCRNNHGVNLESAVGALTFVIMISSASCQNSLLSSSPPLSPLTTTIVSAIDLLISQTSCLRLARFNLRCCTCSLALAGSILSVSRTWPTSGRCWLGCAQAGSRAGGSECGVAAFQKHWQRNAVTTGTPLANENSGLCHAH